MTFNLVGGGASGSPVPPSPQSSTLSTHLYFAGSNSVGESPEDEDSGIGQVKSVRGYRPMLLVPSGGVRKVNSDEESGGAPSADDVSPLPLLTALGESPNYGAKGESSVWNILSREWENFWRLYTESRASLLLCVHTQKEKTKTPQLCCWNICGCVRGVQNALFQVEFYDFETVGSLF